MPDHSRIWHDIWGDDDWMDLTPAAQHLYLVLYTSPDRSLCGAGRWWPAGIAQRAKNWTAEMLERAAEELETAPGQFLIIDRTTEEYLLRSWIKHDGLFRVQNMCVSMANARNALASRTLRGVVVHEVRKLRAKEPSLKSWERDTVVKMLDQKAIDPASLLPASPSSSPSVSPKVCPTASPPSSPGDTSDPSPRVSPGSSPGPTTATAPLAPTPDGGYVTGVRHLEPTQEPPRNCTEHPDGTTAACGACGDARKAHDRWTEQRRRDQAAAQSAEARKRAELRVAAAMTCTLCDENGYRDGRVCSHDPGEDDRRERGMAAVRAVLDKKPKAG